MKNYLTLKARRGKAGFTVIELLVVVALIAILSAVALSQYSSIKLKSRDVKRITSVREIKKALNLYQIENKIFPVHTTAITITGTDAFSTTLEASGLISETPTDPLHPALVFTYQSNPAGSDYDITFCLEGDSVPNYTPDCSNVISP